MYLLLTRTVRHPGLASILRRASARGEVNANLHTQTCLVLILPPPPWCVLTATSVGIRLPRATLNILKSVWLVCARVLQLLSLRSPFLVLVQHFCSEFEMTLTRCYWRMSMKRKWGQCFPLLPRPLSFPLHRLQWV